MLLLENADCLWGPPGFLTTEGLRMHDVGGGAANPLTI